MKNFNVITVALIVVGAILIYCGVKNVTPYQAFQQIIQGSSKNTNVFAGAGQGSKGSAFGKTGGKSGGGGGGGGSGSW